VRLRIATAQDAAAIADIYAPYVTDSVVSFETDPPDAAEMRRRIEAGGSDYPWFAAIDANERLIGYAYASPFRPRAAYRFTVETTVYVAAPEQGKGAGLSLYRQLLATLEAQGFTQAVGAIALPNPASVRLHERLGFQASGLYRQVGYKLGGWHDVGLWQRPLTAAASPPLEPRGWRETVDAAGFDPSR
jgi:L-amino acid N-acyltransferase YncA